MSTQAPDPTEPINRKLVVILAGPTATGKSDVAAKLCETHRGIIVSADSVQAYRGVQIGANKPTKEELKRTPHLLIDVADHNDVYNAAEWTNDAKYCIKKLMAGVDTTMESVTEESKARRRQIDTSIRNGLDQMSPPVGNSALPIVVGGTMMYLQWLVHGRPDSLKPSKNASKKAAMIMDEYSGQSDWQGAVEYVSQKGTVFDNQIQKLSGEDWYRLRRLLEVALTVEEKGDSAVVPEQLYTGEREGGLLDADYDLRCFFLCPDDRMKHTAIIDERCEQMIQRGLIRETSELQNSGTLPDMAAKAIGYRQTLDYLSQSNYGETDEELFLEYLKDFTTATRQYSKRQMQWFRKDDEFFFVPTCISLSKEERIEKAATTISKLLSLGREEYDRTRTSPDGLSRTTRDENERQGPGMKFYQYRPIILKPGTEEISHVLQGMAVARKAKKSRLE